MSNHVFWMSQHLLTERRFRTKNGVHVQVVKPFGAKLLQEGVHVQTELRKKLSCSKKVRTCAGSAEKILTKSSGPKGGQVQSK